MLNIFKINQRIKRNTQMDCISKAASRVTGLPMQSPISKFILLSATPYLVGKIYNHLISGFKSNTADLKAVWGRDS